MRSVALLACVLVLVACRGDRPNQAAAPAGRADAAPPSDAAASTVAAFAIEFARALASGDAAAVAARVPPADAAPVAALWTAQAGAGGVVREVTAVLDPAEPRLAYVTATLERGTVELLVGVAHDQVQRLVVKPLYTPPPYVQPTAFAAEPVTVGAGATALRGELTRPLAARSRAVVLLVQGSGGSDLDEWGGVGNVRPFRDLALGLASAGVAVVRFDKATWAEHAVARRLRNATITAQDEYLDPVADAIAVVRARFPGQPVVLLGHSMGGWLLPWLMRDHAEVAAGIIAAGNARPLVDLLVEQDQHLAKVATPGISAIELELLRRLDADKVARAHDPQLADTTPPEQLPFGMSARSIAFTRGYDAPAVAATLGRPLLLLQGGRDYNVTMVDHQRWRDALAGHDVTAHAYPDLNHVFVTGVGTATPAELSQGGHVAAVVIDDIAGWLVARFPAT